MAGPDPDLYGPWLRLRLRHGALADGAAVARHLALRPTAATATLLQRFQLRPVTEPDGLLLLAKPRWLPQLAAWLRATGGGPLRWRLLACSPQIWGATAMPLEARASHWQLGGRWGQPSASGPADSQGELSLQPLAGATLRLAIPAAAERLTLLDERGEVLLERALTAAERGMGQLRQPLDGLPEGLLQPRFDQGPAPEAVLRLEPEPQGLGVASLWLAPPEPGAALLELEWSLPARASVWHYLLVPSGSQQRLEELAISGGGCVFQGAEQAETLPDGRTAWRMVADRPLPLAERSPYRFRLTGQRIDGTGQSHPLRLDPLPTAPLGPVWPLSLAPAANAPADPLVGISEIVVPL